MKLSLHKQTHAVPDVFDLFIGKIMRLLQNNSLFTINCENLTNKYRNLHLIFRANFSSFDKKTDFKPLHQILPKYILLTLSLILVVTINKAQNFSNSGINVGAKAGGAKLLGEVPYNLSEIINEFDNKTGIVSAFEISKYISQSWEIVTEIGYSNLNGYTFNPEFSAVGIQHEIPSEINEPVEYINKIYSLNFFFRYYFKPVYSESFFVPFFNVGGGYLNYNSKFKYIDASDNDLLFGKGTEGYTKLSTPVFFLGTGFKTSISSKFYIVSSIDLKMVNYDFLDVIHNYNIEKSRIELIGLYTEFKIGIFFNFNKSGDDNHGVKNKKGSSSGKTYLPFSR